MCPRGVYNHKVDIHKVKALVLLRKCGVSFYGIMKAFSLKDKRNLIELYENHKNEFFLPCENSKVVVNKY